jgi:hypothetical protein
MWDYMVLGMGAALKALSFIGGVSLVVFLFCLVLVVINKVYQYFKVEYWSWSLEMARKKVLADIKIVKK